MSDSFKVGDVIRMPHYPTVGGFRVWKVIACVLGATNQEGTYELEPVDIHPNYEIRVPCVMLETHPLVERV